MNEVVRTKPARVRIADPSDEEEIMVICRELHEENGLFPMNEQKVREALYTAFDRKGGVIGAIGHPGRIEALIYLCLSTFWYSDQPHWEELFLYVRSEYRRSRDALELMQFAKWCSAQTGFPLIIGVLSNERLADKVRLYQRQFQAPAGNFYYYAPPCEALLRT